MDASSAFLGYLVGMLCVGVFSLVVALRHGARSQIAAPQSEEEQVRAAFGVLKRHFEKTALAEMQASGAALWTPDPARVAELSYGADPDAPALVGRDLKAPLRGRD